MRLRYKPYHPRVGTHVRRNSFILKLSKVSNLVNQNLGRCQFSMHGRWSRLLSHSVKKSLWSNEICPEHININNSFCLGKSREEVYHLTRNILRFGLSIWSLHYNNVVMGATASKMTGASIVCLTVCSGQIKKRQSSASPAIVKGAHRPIHLIKGQ